MAFDDLVRGVLDRPVLDALRQSKCVELIVQYGHAEKLFNQLAAKVPSEQGLSVSGFSIKSDIRDQVKAVDLVISHAGTGSIMDALRENKKLVVVSNNALMNNHQQEIAQQFGQMGHLILSNSSSSTDIAAAVIKCVSTNLTPLAPAPSQQLAAIIDQEAGVHYLNVDREN